MSLPITLSVRRTFPMAGLLVLTLAGCQEGGPDAALFAPEERASVASQGTTTPGSPTTSFAIDGRVLPISSVTPGALAFAPTGSLRGPGGGAPGAVREVGYGSWRIEQYLADADRAGSLEQLVARDDLVGVLAYENADGVPVRETRFTGGRAIGYELVETDRGPLEVLELAVEEVSVWTAPGDPGIRQEPAECWVAEGLRRGPFGTGGRRVVKRLDDVVAFRFRIEGSGAVGDDWHLFSGAGIHCATPSAGATVPTAAELRRASRERFPEIEVRGPVVAGGSRVELFHIFNAWVAGDPATFRAILELLNAEGEVTRTVDMSDSFPRRWDPGEYSPSSSTEAEETVVMKSQEIEIA